MIYLAKERKIFWAVAADLRRSNWECDFYLKSSAHQPHDGPSGPTESQWKSSWDSVGPILAAMLYGRSYIK